jgi:hypothetical protein
MTALDVALILFPLFIALIILRVPVAIALGFAHIMLRNLTQLKGKFQSVICVLIG